ncbi:MAG TPA: hypothetical protein VN106_10355, partial [Sphingomicrobium sp.]|nr:hypothetical protein [Sphingomicrobium sp.]
MADGLRERRERQDRRHGIYSRDGPFPDCSAALAMTAEGAKTSPMDDLESPGLGLDLPEVPAASAAA